MHQLEAKIGTITASSLGLCSSVNDKEGIPVISVNGLMGRRTSWACASVKCNSLLNRAHDAGKFHQQVHAPKFHNTKVAARAQTRPSEQAS
jgi:hypothetical protein